MGIHIKIYYCMSFLLAQIGYNLLSKSNKLISRSELGNKMKAFSFISTYVNWKTFLLNLVPEPFTSALSCNKKTSKIHFNIKIDDLKKCLKCEVFLISTTKNNANLNRNEVLKRDEHKTFLKLCCTHKYHNCILWKSCVQV